MYIYYIYSRIFTISSIYIYTLFTIYPLLIPTLIYTYIPYTLPYILRDIRLV